MKTVEVYVRIRQLPARRGPSPKYAADIMSNPFPRGILGCPMGRGHTPLAAVADLHRRVREESGIKLEVSFC